MTWSMMKNDWPRVVTRLETRFPNIPHDVRRFPPDRSTDFVRKLARSHDLTEFEAREELADWMYVEGLART